MKPMLLERTNPDTATLPYPVYAFPKLDGIRCVIVEGMSKSRTLKDIPNKHIQSVLNKAHLSGLDGELIVGDPNSPTVYRDTNSFVMAYDKVGPFKYYVFDYWDSLQPYNRRYDILNLIEILKEYPQIEILPCELVQDEKHLLEFEERCLENGYEGVIIRCLKGLYKSGRTTMKEQNTYKLKRFVDDEAIVIGFEEEMHNGNNKELNELGRTKRSTAKTGLTGKGTLGAIIARTPEGIEFAIGSGFDAKDRKQLWDDRLSIIGTTIKYKSFPIGVKDKPRHPIFLGFRDMEIDG